MSAEEAQALDAVEVHGEDQATATSDGHIRQQMTNVREAFRMRRLARDQPRLYGLYDEHSLFDEARSSRRRMMQLLCTARPLWCRALGLVP